MDGICRSSYALRPWTGCIRGAAGPCGSRPLCGLAFFLPLRMTVYIRFKPSHLSRLALKRNAREIQYCTALPQIGMRYCRLHVPRYRRRLRVTIGARWIRTRRDPVIMQTRYLQRGDLFERPASKAAVVCFGLGWDGMWFMRKGNTTAFWAARVC